MIKPYTPRITLKPMQVRIPKSTCVMRQHHAQAAPIQEVKTRMKAVAEEREKIFMIQRRDRRKLQLQQCGLARIRINGMHAPRARQRIVERVAAGAGDHQHRVAGPQRQCCAIHCRIFPTGVIDQRAAIQRRKQRVVKSARDGVN